MFKQLTINVKADTTSFIFVICFYIRHQVQAGFGDFESGKLQKNCFANIFKMRSFAETVLSFVYLMYSVNKNK